MVTRLEYSSFPSYLDADTAAITGFDGDERGKGVRGAVFAAQQAVGAIHQMQISGIEENGIQFGNHPSIYGADNFHQFQHNLPPLHLREKNKPALGCEPSASRSWARRSNPDSFACKWKSGTEVCYPSILWNVVLGIIQMYFLVGLLKIHAHKAIGDPNLQTTGENVDIRVESLEFVPELINLVNRATLEEAEDIRSRADSHSDTSADVLTVHNSNEPPSNELEPGNVQVQWDAESDGDVKSNNSSKIEPTTAEAEALAKGLQTIHNDDLEEIRELGSGTYGAVYHGKWRGSDVAIKRIKASCFAGKPSERERLIADFWKEALILSSLHHPNVVSFYGVVRDGPDGSLATVTEFMVNGSLKQFLQKKDRTIDRRKRLIIAMDVAFGDLGLSKVKQHTLVSGGIRGTLPWMAPELLSGKTSMVSEKIDVYSFGIVMWELLTGEEPYSDMHCASIIGGIVNSTLRPQIPSWCDPRMEVLDGKLLVHRSNRATILLRNLSKVEENGSCYELEVNHIPLLHLSWVVKLHKQKTLLAAKDV
ncbi:hypothetical protein HPP92_015349 [Vanilla planifolia]|uniref:Protein kinase domain-containing protein n=1 Tax=Vanilla planifolia TaxID=51239 RepID=A0A835QRC7_VANPL|nr:hypothetical protein HPP92_015349 [Vanilla planifolia]